MTITTSRYGALELKPHTITERLFEGLTGRESEVVLTEGASGRQVTAGALMDGIRAFAGGLTRRGHAPGHTIAIMAPNLPEYAIVFHGACWAGDTVTTINPTYTATEVRHQLKDSGAGLLVTIPAFLDTARQAAEGTGVREIVVIGEAEGAVPLASLMGPPLAVQAPVDVATHIAALPYSSGTTGLPKGVMLSHRNLVANVDQCLPMTDIRPGETAIAFLPFFHIYGMNVLMNLYLVAGGRLVTMPRFDLEGFLRLAQDHRAAHLWIVPPVALALAKHPLVDKFDLSSVRKIVSGAAPLGAELSDAMAKRLGIPSTQGYGMTEMSPVSHITPLGAPRAGAAGLTVPGTECRIVDFATGSDAAPGEEGELWVRGPQVMLGYVNNPAATAATIDADGWLHTGDLAIFDADGYLFIRDRVKELIKFKGFQIAPAEVEAVLTSHPQIADAAVIGLPDEEAGEVPMAVLVAAQGQSPDPAAIRAYVGEHLSSYKKPGRIEFTDAIPKSASGKILRRVLRDKYRV